MESPISPNFEALDPFLPSFLRIPASLRDALDPAPSPRRVDTVHRARNDVAPPKLRLNVQSSPRKQTVRRLASSRAQEEQHVAKMPELWIWNKFHGLKNIFFFEPPIWQSNMTTMGIGYGFKSHEQLRYPDSAHLYGFCSSKFDSWEMLRTSLSDSTGQLRVCSIFRQSHIYGKNTSIFNPAIYGFFWARKFMGDKIFGYPWTDRCHQPSQYENPGSQDVG